MKISNRRIGILFIFVIIILIESISLATYQTAKLGEANKKNLTSTKNVTLTQEEQETLDLINKYRNQNGLASLTPLLDLQEVSKLKAKDLIENSYFSHTSPNFGNPFEMLTKNEIDYSIAGENLAGNINPQKAIEAWINSPSHKENILEDKFEYTGICVRESPIYGKVFVQLFVGIKES